MRGGFVLAVTPPVQYRAGSSFTRLLHVCFFFRPASVISGAARFEESVFPVSRVFFVMLLDFCVLCTRGSARCIGHWCHMFDIGNGCVCTFNGAYGIRSVCRDIHCWFVISPSWFP